MLERIPERIFLFHMTYFYAISLWKFHLLRDFHNFCGMAASSFGRLFSGTQQSASCVTPSVFHPRARVQIPTEPLLVAQRLAACVGRIWVLLHPGFLFRRSARPISPPGQCPSLRPRQECPAEFLTQFSPGCSPRFSFRLSFDVWCALLRLAQSSPKAQQT